MPDGGLPIAQHLVQVRPHGIAAIYSSQLARARETAEIVAAELGLEVVRMIEAVDVSLEQNGARVDVGAERSLT